MNGIEALQAMKDGKIVIHSRGVRFRFHDGVVQSFIMGWSETANDAGWFLRQGDDDFEVYEEGFVLTFVQAFQAMLDGKRVVCERYRRIHQYIKNGTVFNCDLEDGGEYPSFILEYEQKALWKVVE